VIALDAKYVKTTIPEAVTLSPEQFLEIGPTWVLTAIKVQLSRDGTSEGSSVLVLRSEDVNRENQ